MNNKLKTQAVEQLFQAILSLKDLDEAYDFFEDVCTINEILSLSQRFEVAKMLREHRTYLDIAEKTPTCRPSTPLSYFPNCCAINCMTSSRK